VWQNYQLVLNEQILISYYLLILQQNLICGGLPAK
jgi:hypothetical protein